MKMLVFMATMPLVAMAETVELPKVPEPKYADCEESLSKPMALWKDGTRTVTTTIECDCTASNALRVAFGRDANKNGELDLNETRLQFGWDATGWVLRSFDQWLDFDEPVKLEKERRTLKVSFRFDADGNLVGFAAWDGMKRIFEDVSKSLPKGLYPKDADIVEVKRNGMGEPNERVTISIDPQHNTGYFVPGHHTFIMPNAIKGSGKKEDKPEAILALADPNNPSERDDLMRKAAAAGDPLAKAWTVKNGLK